MRALTLLVVSVFAAIGIALAALGLAGSTASGVTGLSSAKAAAVAVSSIGRSPFLQIALAAGPGAGALGALSVDYDVSAEHPPTDIADAAASGVDVGVDVREGGALVLGLRVVAREIYLNVDLASFGALPGAARLGPLGAGILGRIFSGRWFELPSGIAALAPAITPSVGTQKSALVEGIRAALLRATSFADGPPSGADRVVVASGSALDIYRQLPLGVRALIALALRRAGASHLAPGSGAGAYQISLTITPGGELTNAAVRIGTGSATAVVSHDAVPVAAPAGAVQLPLQAIRSLLGVLGALGSASSPQPSI